VNLFCGLDGQAIERGVAFADLPQQQASQTSQESKSFTHLSIWVSVTTSGSSIRLASILAS
jgi:hypothetical protein